MIATHLHQGIVAHMSGHVRLIANRHTIAEDDYVLLSGRKGKRPSRLAHLKKYIEVQCELRCQISDLSVTVKLFIYQCSYFATLNTNIKEALPSSRLVLHTCCPPPTSPGALEVPSAATHVVVWDHPLPAFLHVEPLGQQV